MPHDFPDTRASLLVNLRDPANEQAWSAFTKLYRPVIYRMARRRGLQEADAQDLAQRVLISVAKTISEWEPDRQYGRFRNWLSRVTRNAIIDTFRSIKPDVAAGGSVVTRILNQSPAAHQTEIEYEYERSVFRQAARVVRREFKEPTWIAFWETTVENRPIVEVATELNQSVGSLYTARSRVMKRLREVVDDIK